MERAFIVIDWKWPPQNNGPLNILLQSSTEPIKQLAPSARKSELRKAFPTPSINRVCSFLLVSLKSHLSLYLSVTIHTMASSLGTSKFFPQKKSNTISSFLRYLWWYPTALISSYLISDSVCFCAEMEHVRLVVDVDDPGPDEAQPKFRIRDLKKKSDAGVPILNGINVDIPKGVIVGIIGPSGSGKSTMLRALNRLWEPPLGTVFLDGRDICKLDVLSLRRKVGMLFQLPALFEGTFVVYYHR